MNNNEIVLFETLDNEIKLSVIMQNDTVWLTANQMAGLFGRDEKTIRKHVNNVFRENEVAYENNTQKMRVDGVKQLVDSGSVLFHIKRLGIICSSIPAVVEGKIR